MQILASKLLNLIFSFVGICCKMENKRLKEVEWSVANIVCCEHWPRCSPIVGTSQTVYPKGHLEFVA